jgi:alkylhydroperoxidase family enzyme
LRRRCRRLIFESGLDSPHAAVGPHHHVGNEQAVLLSAIEVSATSQQRCLVGEALQRSPSGFDRAVLVAGTAVVCASSPSRSARTGSPPYNSRVCVLLEGAAAVNPGYDLPERAHDVYACSRSGDAV